MTKVPTGQLGTGRNENRATVISPVESRSGLIYLLTFSGDEQY
jgi:hypothetical protein